MLSREGQREQEAARAVMILRRAEGVEAMRTPRAVATSVLKAADKADRTNGIMRVDVRDEATIEKVSRVIHGETDPDCEWRLTPDTCEVCRDSLHKARAVLAALEQS